MSNSEYYQDKICIVTGANSGIGFALSEELLKRGATVYMVGRNPEKVAKAARELSEFKDRVHTIIVDVTVQEQVENAINDTVAETGRLDFLFNNAGVGGTLQFETATMDDWKNIINVNLWTFQALYSLTKYGVTGLTECLRYEYAEKDLHFSTICPANIATPIFKKSIDGTTHDEIKIPDDAYPVDKAAILILDRVAEHKGIIVVPEEPYTEMWKKYIQGDEEMEEVMMHMARDRRAAYETGGNYY
ncbi:MAG: SDR family oxidoreductase [Methanobacterium sp.]|nr:SDR family oxidoreductase [Methanobacterium sp.]